MARISNIRGFGCHLKKKNPHPECDAPDKGPCRSGGDFFPTQMGIWTLWP